MSTPSTASHTNACAQTEEWTSRLVATGAGASPLVKVRGKGWTGNTRQGVGIYTLSLVDGSTLADVEGKAHTAATVGPLVVKYVAGSYVKATMTQPATIQVEFWSLVVPALTDPPAGSLVSIEVTFFTNVVD